MTEDLLPAAAFGHKGRVRATIWSDAFAAHEAGWVRVTGVRAADYFGPGAGDQTPVGTRFVPPLLVGKRVRFLGDPAAPHSWTYLPDVARALAVAGTDGRALGRAWHVPTNPPLSAQALADRLCVLAGAPAPRITRMPHWVMNAIGGAVADGARATRDPVPIRPAFRGRLLGLRIHLRRLPHPHR